MKYTLVLVTLVVFGAGPGFSQHEGMIGIWVNPRLGGERSALLVYHQTGIGSLAVRDDRGVVRVWFTYRVIDRLRDQSGDLVIRMERFLAFGPEVDALLTPPAHSLRERIRSSVSRMLAGREEDLSYMEPEELRWRRLAERQRQVIVRIADRGRRYEERVPGGPVRLVMYSPQARGPVGIPLRGTSY